VPTVERLAFFWCGRLAWRWCLAGAACHPAAHRSGDCAQALEES